MLAQTIGVIRFRRRLRRCILATSLAGCYVAGLATTGLLVCRQAEHRHGPPSLAIAEASGWRTTEPVR